MKFWLLRMGKVPLGVAMAVLAIAVMVSADWQLLSAIALVAVAIGIWEAATMLKLALYRRLSLVVVVIVACILCRYLLIDSRSTVNEFFSLVMLLWLIGVPLWMLRRPVLPPAVMASCIVLMLVGAWFSLTVLAEYDRLLLIFGLIAVWLADIAAFLAGKSFGSNRLAPKISPHKTWEGVVGALFALHLLTVAAWLISDSSYPYWMVLLFSSALSALACVGDLAESLFKRQAGLKDSSRLLGSHGGLLDRIDSWFPVLPFLGLLSSHLVTAA